MQVAQIAATSIHSVWTPSWVGSMIIVSARSGVVGLEATGLAINVCASFGVVCLFGILATRSGSSERSVMCSMARGLL